MLGPYNHATNRTLTPNRSCMCVTTTRLAKLHCKHLVGENMKGVPNFQWKCQFSATEVVRKTQTLKKINNNRMEKLITNIVGKNQTIVVVTCAFLPRFETRKSEKFSPPIFIVRIIRLLLVHPLVICNFINLFICTC